jgi:deazaflavin-dependent oxidoreductase (nitroreductase family)
MNYRNEFKDLQLKGMNLLHRSILQVSGGRWLNHPMGMQTVELHTIGRKTGQHRAVLLTAPIHDDTRTVVIASKGGDDRNPEWYLNLVANPEVELTIEGVTTKMRARTASEQEKAELWPTIVAANKGYAGYQQKTTRPIPVVICEPVA